MLVTTHSSIITNVSHSLEIFIGLDERYNKRMWEHGRTLLLAETCRNGTQDIDQHILPCIYGSSGVLTIDDAIEDGGEATIADRTLIVGISIPTLHNELEVLLPSY